MRLRNSQRVLCLAMLSFMVAPLVWGQARVTIDTNMPEAIVYADSIRLGEAAQQRFLLPEDTQTLHLIPPVRGAWSITPLHHALGSVKDSAHVRLHFPYHYQIETIPYGATVYQMTLDGRRYLGETPFVHRTDSPLIDNLLVERLGYEQLEITPGQEVWNRYMLSLKPLALVDTEAAVEVDWLPPRENKRWIDVLALGTTLVGGALAVHYKFKADRRFDDHKVNGDPRLKSDIKRYDLYSGIALGGMQAGFTVFTVRLIRRR